MHNVHKSYQIPIVAKPEAVAMLTLRILYSVPVHTKIIIDAYLAIYGRENEGFVDVSVETFLRDENFKLHRQKLDQILLSTLVILKSAAARKISKDHKEAITIIFQERSAIARELRNLSDKTTKKLTTLVRKSLIKEYPELKVKNSEGKMGVDQLLEAFDQFVKILTQYLNSAAL